MNLSQAVKYLSERFCERFYPFKSPIEQRYFLEVSVPYLKGTGYDSFRLMKVFGTKRIIFFVSVSQEFHFEYKEGNIMGC